MQQQQHDSMMVMIRSFLLLLVYSFIVHASKEVPPMGWNSWNAFHCDITEDKIKTAAQYLLPNLLESGYNYVNLDDCWMSPNRTKDGKYQGHLTRFPSGMKAMGDYLHSHGFKFGIYTSAGTHTCQKFPGSLGYETMDAQTFADWGVDYLKYDNCYSQNIPGIDRYTTMRDALLLTKRDIFYSICQWGGEDSWQWAPALGDSWRTTTDINPSWGSIRGNFWTSQEHAAARNLLMTDNMAFLDPDMLEVGNGDLTFEESKTHFSLWCLAKAPLLLGNDLTTMTNETLLIISNPHLIGLHQNPKVPQAVCFHGCSSRSDWSLLVTTYEHATVVMIVNWSDVRRNIQYFAGHTVGVVPLAHEQVSVKDLWSNHVVGIYKDYEELKKIPVPVLEPHSCIVYQLSVMATLMNDEVEKY